MTALYYLIVVKEVSAYVRQHGLWKPGDRVGVAVSGGADSVALLRALVELREEMGIVLSVIHFNHQIRGAASDADEAFVTALAVEYGLPFHRGAGDTPAHARESGKSLETAARNLRYRFFKELLTAGAVNRIATAHTLDDQAETLLMRLLRGAGTRGLAGVFPAQNLNSGSGETAVVRPLLQVSRKQIEEYLRELAQEWREDMSNADPRHTRNRIRHELLPLLARNYNPSVIETLARTAEVARAEEEYWAQETARLLPLALLPGAPARGGGRAVPVSTATAGTAPIALNIEALRLQPMALRRRLIRAAAESLGITTGQEHVEEVLRLTSPGASGKSVELPGHWSVRRSFRELRFQQTGAPAVSGYAYAVSLPGEVEVPEANIVVRARLQPLPEGPARYNHASAKLGTGYDELPAQLAGLTVRNFRAGDRFWPLHSRSEKKVKELLQQLKVPQPERGMWPVVVSGDRLLWVRGVPARPVMVHRQGRPYHILIEEANGSKTTKDLNARPNK